MSDIFLLNELAALRAENEKLRIGWETVAGQYDDLLQEASRLRAENERFKSGYHGACYVCEYVGELNEKLLAKNEKLRAALQESADELDAYYRAEYPGEHPYSQKKLAQALASNPARAALEERT